MDVRLTIFYNRAIVVLLKHRDNKAINEAMLAQLLDALAPYQYADQVDKSPDGRLTIAPGTPSVHQFIKNDLENILTGISAGARSAIIEDLKKVYGL